MIRLTDHYIASADPCDQSTTSSRSLDSRSPRVLSSLSALEACYVELIRRPRRVRSPLPDEVLASARGELEEFHKAYSDETRFPRIRLMVLAVLRETTTCEADDEDHNEEDDEDRVDDYEDHDDDYDEDDDRRRPKTNLLVTSRTDKSGTSL